MKKLSLSLFFTLFITSTNVNAWFFFWIPLGGAKSNSSSPVTSDSKDFSLQPQQSGEIPKPVIQNLVNEEKAPSITQSSEQKSKDLTFQNKPQLSDTIQSVGAKKLIELKGLLDQGLITQKDYDQKKTEILRNM